MPQVVDLPPIGQDARGALVALVRVCKETPTKESFRDFRSRLRNGATDDELRAGLKDAVLQKEARHHIGEPEFVAPPRSMSCIGG